MIIGDQDYRPDALVASAQRRRDDLILYAKLGVAASAVRGIPPPATGAVVRLPWSHRCADGIIRHPDARIPYAGKDD